MIKCTYFSKLLKLGLFTLLIGFFGFGLGSFVNADDSYIHLVDFGQVGAVSSVSYDFNFSTNGDNFYQATTSQYASSRIWWQSDGFLHFNKRNYSQSSSSAVKGKITGFFVCSSLNLGGNVYLRNLSGTCEYYFGFGSDFMDYLSDCDKWGYWYNSNSSNTWNVLCGVNSLNSTAVCVDYSYYDSEGYGVYSDSQISELAVINPYNFNSINNNEIIGGESVDGFNYIGTDEENLVSYFEDDPYYKFDDNVCYVGTDDFSLYYSLDDNPIFYKGYGDNIFDLYSFLYGNTYNIKQVGMFINAWATNYMTWFQGKNRNEWGDIDWLAGYSSNSGYYQIFGTGLYNPFYGERLAVYFMGMNTSSYMKLSSTLGEEIATYCYYKLTGDINTGYNITDNSDSSFWNNAGQFSQNLRRFKTYFSGSDSIQSQSREGTPLQYLSGDDDLDFSTFFSKSFNKFKDSFTINPNDLGAGFLPTYIILFLLAIIVFRFISH